MHNAAFKELGIDAEYRLFEIPPEKLEDFILNRKDVIGFNVTIPHKVRAKEILEKNFPLAVSDIRVTLSGALNTVRRENDKLEYINTDVLGFFTSLKEDLKFNHINKNALLIGCGGAGRGVIAGLCAISNKIYVYDKSSETMEIAREFFKLFPEAARGLDFISEGKIPEVIKDCHLLVNTSPVGMKEGDFSPIDKKLLHKNLSVYDVIYNRKTQLIKDAESLGLPSANGLGMFLHQGCHAFEFWTGKKAPIDVMKTALQKALS
jgi:shikimate dehydrogenase